MYHLNTSAGELPRCPIIITIIIGGTVNAFTAMPKVNCIVNVNININISKKIIIAKFIIITMNQVHGW